MNNEADIKEILTTTRTIAIVGLSSTPGRASGAVARYLMSRGYKIIPVNPQYSEIFGLESHASLLDIPAGIRVDLVDVFRKSEETPAIARDAVAIGARCLWLQLGIENDEACRIASASGLICIQNHCIKIEHMSNFPEEQKR